MFIILYRKTRLHADILLLAIVVTWDTGISVVRHAIPNDRPICREQRPPLWLCGVLLDGPLRESSHAQRDGERSWLSSANLRQFRRERGLGALRE